MVSAISTRRTPNIDGFRKTLGDFQKHLKIMHLFLLNSVMEALNARLLHAETMMREILVLLNKKKTRTEYQKEYYARKTKQARQEQGRIRNPDCNNLNLPFGHDSRLRSKIPEWAAIAYRFAALEYNGAYEFLQWLAYTWNSETYHEQVITKSGGYYHIFCGFSGTRALRTKRTDNDLFGCVRRSSFTRAQRQQFANALWWNWGYGVLGKVVFEMQEDEERWAALPKHFTKPLLLMMGYCGEVEVRPGLMFDQTEEDPVLLGKVYTQVREALNKAWQACMRGLHAKEQNSVPEILEVPI